MLCVSKTMSAVLCNFGRGIAVMKLCMIEKSCVIEKTDICERKRCSPSWSV